MYEILPSFFNNKYSPFNNSLPDVIAILAGVKPFTRLSYERSDKNYQRFAKLAEDQGLYVAAARDKTGHSSRNNLNHVYLSKSKNTVDFYRLSDPENKVQPLGKTDERKFASDLGYPKCCIENYFKNAQKGIVSSFLTQSGFNQAHFYFNNHLHSISNYFLSFHVPCSLECEETKKYNGKIFKAIEKFEPEMALRLKKILTAPLLVWYNTDNKHCFDDRIVILFDGAMNNNEIEYSNCLLLKTNYPNNINISKRLERSLTFLKKGNRLKCTGKEICIWRGETLIHKISNQTGLKGVLFKYHV